MTGYTTEALQHEADLLAVMPRPKAPARYRLTAEESEEWDKIVAALPPNWFAEENYGILAAHVRLIVQCSDFADMIKECKKKKDWVNARHLSIEHRALLKDVKAFATKLKIMTRANEATKRHELSVRKKMERHMPTVRHASPWDARSEAETDNTRTGSPWVKRGGAMEAAE